MYILYSETFPASSGTGVIWAKCLGQLCLNRFLLVILMKYYQNLNVQPHAHIMHTFKYPYCKKNVGVGHTSSRGTSWTSHQLCKRSDCKAVQGPKWSQMVYEVMTLILLGCKILRPGFNNMFSLHCSSTSSAKRDVINVTSITVELSQHRKKEILHSESIIVLSNIYVLINKILPYINMSVEMISEPMPIYPKTRVL